MKFVCDRCQTRYSIADEKVRQKILKIRCKTCDNVITVRDSAEPSGAPAAARATGPAPAPRATGPSVPAARTTGAHAAVGARTGSSPGGSLPTGAIGAIGSVGRASLPRPPTPPAPPPPRTDPGPVEWHLAVDGSDEGPFNRVDLVRKVLAQRPGADVHVWKEGFDAWKAPKDVPELAREMSAQRLRPPSALPPPPGRRPSNGSGAPSNGHAVSLAALSGAKAERNAAQAAAKAAAISDAGFDDGEATAIQSLDAALVAESVPPGRSQHDGGGEPAGALPPIGAGTGLEGLDLSPTRAPTPAPASPYASPYVPAPAGALGSASISASAPAAGESSALMRAASGGLFARNPAMKYVVAAGAVVALVIVVVIASIGRSAEVKAPPKDEPATAASPGGPKPAEDPEAEARRKAEAWFGKTQQGQDPNAGPSSKAIVGAPGRPSLIRRLLGSKPGDKGTAQTAPPPVGSTEPPPVNPNELSESRKLTGALGGDRAERVARPLGPSAPAGGGEVSQEKLSAVVTNRVNQDAIKSCYNRALRHDGANMKGRLDVTVSIGASGRVKNVSLASGPELQSVHGCVKTAISRWVFPAAHEEYAFGFPLILQGS